MVWFVVIGLGLCVCRISVKFSCLWFLSVLVWVVSWLLLFIWVVSSLVFFCVYLCIGLFSLFCVISWLSVVFVVLGSICCMYCWSVFCEGFVMLLFDDVVVMINGWRVFIRLEIFSSWCVLMKLRIFDLVVVVGFRCCVALVNVFVEVLFFVNLVVCVWSESNLNDMLESLSLFVSCRVFLII